MPTANPLARLAPLQLDAATLAELDPSLLHALQRALRELGRVEEARAVWAVMHLAEWGPLATAG